ncbi:MAG TPA: SDR family NAD(P)-dependent oxidoreductase, partial [Geodermatophilus sp.]|nr:SDR family NAD(P)-dependent oxidoreductase [Geodermatophilus sp.]
MPEPQLKLKPVRDQVVVVMGASSGIGRATAARFAAKGAKVVVAARGGRAPVAGRGDPGGGSRGVRRGRGRHRSHPDAAGGAARGDRVRPARHLGARRGGAARRAVRAD